MKFTIVVPDGIMSVDGEFRVVDLTGIDANIHAVHWNETVGTVEFNNSSTAQIIDSSPYQDYIDRWNVLTPPPVVPPTFLENKAAKMVELAAVRFAHESGGILLMGMPIDTDRESQGLINGAIAAFERGAISAVNWKTADGFVTLDQATMLAIGTAVAQHVQACFTREMQIAQEIGAMTTQGELNGVNLETGWP